MPKKNKAGAQSLLIELLTEELPPRSLRRIAGAFAAGINEGLRAQHFLDGESAVETFATPRRLAVRVSGVLPRQPDRLVDRKGPPASAALDAEGRPTPALLGFARSCGTDVSRLKRHKDARGEYFLWRTREKGKSLSACLGAIVETAAGKLPAPKLMRWGANSSQFIRPVHGLILLHGSRVIPGRLFGLKSGRTTLGHRFLGKGTIAFRRAGDYERVLETRGKVIASFDRRRERIERALRRAAAARRAAVFPDEEAHDGLRNPSDTGAGSRRMQVARVILQNNAELLDEVTAMTEWPKVHAGRFEREFLEVPPECISLTMQKNQKYFALTGRTGALLPDYLIVSNTDTVRPRAIIEGNARVLRARLSDARFFVQQDEKLPLAERVSGLVNVVYHNRLGSQFERVERIKLLAAQIGRRTGADLALVERAAWLCKADLLTGMVGEFPELQGFIGAHYAQHDGEPPEVVAAIEGHYRPRFAGDRVAHLSPVSICLALADKLDTLAGMFGIGQRPSGDKDPFGLRRAGLGVLRILIECDLALDLPELVGAAFAGYGGPVIEARTVLEDYLFDRLAVSLAEKYSTLEVDAVVSLRPARIHLVPRQLEAVRIFNRLPEAESLAAANKRVVNILRQAEAAGEKFLSTKPQLLKEAAERRLFDALHATSERATRLFDQGDFTGYLKSFAVLKTPVDAFFDAVMVMTDDPALRSNRLALLSDLRREMNRVADISKLAA